MLPGVVTVELWLVGQLNREMHHQNQLEAGIDRVAVQFRRKRDRFLNAPLLERGKAADAVHIWWIRFDPFIFNLKQFAEDVIGLCRNAGRLYLGSLLS